MTQDFSRCGSKVLVDGKNECVDCFNRLEAEGFQPLNIAYNGVAPFLRCCGLEWTT